MNSLASAMLTLYRMTRKPTLDATLPARSTQMCSDFSGRAGLQARVAVVYCLSSLGEVAMATSPRNLLLCAPPLGCAQAFGRLEEGEMFAMAA